MLFAVIPARAGSKRLHGKNSRLLLGKSLVQRTVATAIASKLFSRIIVTTDSREIAAQAEMAGAEIPFIRPAALAGDDADSTAVLCHATGNILAQADYMKAVMCLLQPTSPLLTGSHIAEAYQIFTRKKLNSLSSMTSVFQHPEWLFKKSEVADGLVQPVYPELFAQNSLENYFIENGALYLVKADYLMENDSLYDFDNHGIYLMNRLDSLDIDTQDDWNLAEFYLAKQGD
jgi:CMP-N,N'-diacetyllegionaminic acid synthase